MVSAWLVAALIAAPGELAPSLEPVGCLAVVGVVRGAVVDGDGRALGPGAPLGVGGAADVEGFAELLLDGARVRAGDGARVELACERSGVVVAVERGRADVRVEPGRRLGLRVRALEARLEGASGALADVALGRAALVARRGRVVVAGAALAPRARVEAEAPERAEPTRGALLERVDAEARRARGDDAAWRALLLGWARGATLGPLDVRGLDGVLRGSAELGASTPTWSLLETSLRPPAFFDTEVPTKGPNLRVDVGFRDE
jgi:hypothetical protein